MPLLTPPEVMRELKWSYRTLQRAVADGLLRPVQFRPHGRLRFRREDLDEFVASHGREEIRQRIAAGTSIRVGKGT